MIKPTVGRIVLFVPKETCNQFGFYVQAGQEHAAIITCVHSDTCVNLSVFDLHGKPFSKTSVELVQDDKVCEWDHCRWMPYQIEKAKKYEGEKQAA